jgi:succinylarginine dihydrolase
VLPPHERPYLPALRRLGFGGTDAQVLAKAHGVNPALLSAASSASSMWAANAATVAASSDTGDGRLHFTPANLVSMFHRSLEAETTTRLFRRIFADTARFAVHDALPPHPDFADEGAANHTHLSTARGSAHLFAFGRAEGGTGGPTRFPARQTRAASAAVARLHELEESGVVLWQQHPDGIDQGAFHTDVLAVGSSNLLLVHELAFVDLPALKARLRSALGDELRVVVASEAELPARDAIKSYPFNSELVTGADGARYLVSPSESRENTAAARFLERLVSDERCVAGVVYVDVNGSMKNGGGPACLRLRVPLTENERNAIAASVFFDSALDSELSAWVRRHYRDRLALDDLVDPQFLDETRRALDELSTLLGLGSVYEFQKP